MKPVDILHDTARNTVTITWENDSVSELPVPYLRAWCPCAGCQGHGTVVRYRPAPQDVTIEQMFEAGAYAIHIRFSDDHDAGIYSWRWLERIAPESPPRGLKTGRFEGAAYIASD